MKKFYLSVTLLFLVHVSFSQSSFLDPTFGNNGTAITNFGSKSFLYSMTIASDGKIVAAGTVNNTDFAVARYNANGTADNSFGTNGKVITDLGNFEDAKSVVIQTDGKVVVAGNTQTGNYPNIQSKIAVVRYNTDGSLDNSFGSSGKVITSDKKQTIAYAMALQPDGKIVVTGSTSDDGTYIDIITIRFNADGTLDNSFGNNGKVITTIDPYIDNEGYAIALQADGKILVTGLIYDDASNSSPGVLIRYLQNGMLDSSFDNDGYTIDYAAVPTSLTVQANGKILVGGRGYNDNYDFYGYVTRYNTDGSRDETYNKYGIVAGGYYSKFTSDVYSVALQSDGKAVVSVSRKSGFPDYENSLGVIRLTANGYGDTTFGNHGIIGTKVDSIIYNYPPGNPIAITSDGKILLGVTYKNNFTVVRLLKQDDATIAGNQATKQFKHSCLSKSCCR